MTNIDSKIIFLRGQKNDLPEQLDVGEFGFAVDDGTLVIGGDPRVGQANADRTAFPYRNIEILTERSSETFAALHGTRMREGTEFDYYEARLEPDRLGWTPVPLDIDGEYAPYRIEILNSVSAFFDYTVTENNSGEPIRDGQMIIWHHDALGNVGGAQFTDRSSMPRERDLTNPSNYDPRQVFEKVKFRFRISDDYQFLDLEYKNYTFDFLILQFRVSRPLDGGIKNVITGQVIIDADLQGVSETIDPPYPLFAVMSGQGETSDGGVDTYFPFLIPNKVITDSKNDIYIAGQYTIVPTDYSVAVLVKYNNDMELIWHRSLIMQNGSFNSSFKDIAVHDGKIWVCGYAQEDEKYFGIVARFSPDGVLEQRFIMDDTGNANVCFNSMIVTNTQIYLAGYNASSAAAMAIDIITGVPTWYNMISSAYNFDFSNIIMTDSSIIVVGYIDYSELYVVKYDLVGAVLWEKCFDSQGYGFTGETSAVADVNGNIYIGDIDHLNNDNFFVTKLASDGTLLWERYYGVDSSVYASDPFLFLNEDTLHVLSSFTRHAPIAGVYSGITLVDLTLDGVYIRSRVIDARYTKIGYPSMRDRYISAHVSGGYFYIVSGNAGTSWHHKGHETTLSRFQFDRTSLNFDDMHLYIPEPQWALTTTFNSSGYIAVDPNILFSTNTSTALQVIPSNIAEVTVGEISLSDPTALVASVSIEVPYGVNGAGWMAEQTYATDFSIVAIATSSTGEVYQLVQNLNTQRSFYLLKLDNAGAIAWTRTFAYPLNSSVGYASSHTILIDEFEDGIYISHNESSPTNSGFYVTKLSTDALTVLWHKNYFITSSAGSSFNTEPGLIWLTIAGPENAGVNIALKTATNQYFMKVSKTNGSVMLSTSYDGIASIWAQVADGDFIYACTVTNSGLSYIVAKYNINTNALAWQKTISITGSSRYLVISSLHMDNDGNLMIVANENIFSGIHSDKSRRIIAKVSPLGAALVDHKVYTLTTHDERIAWNTVDTARDPVTGNIFILSILVNHQNGSYDGLVEAFDNDMMPLWGRVIATEGVGYPTTINLMPNDSLLVSWEYESIIKKGLLFKIPRSGELYLRDSLFTPAVTFALDPLVPIWGPSAALAGTATNPAITALSADQPTIGALMNYTHGVSSLP